MCTFVCGLVGGVVYASRSALGKCNSAQIWVYTAPAVRSNQKTKICKLHIIKLPGLKLQLTRIQIWQTLRFALTISHACKKALLCPESHSLFTILSYFVTTVVAFPYQVNLLHCAVIQSHPSRGQFGK